MERFIRWVTPPTSPKWWLCAIAGWAFSAVLFKGGYIAPGPVPFALFLVAAAAMYYAGVQDAVSRFGGHDDGPDDGDDPEPDIDPTGPGGLERELAELIRMETTNA